MTGAIPFSIDDSFNANNTDDLSVDPLSMRHLTESQKEHLGVLLEQYLSALESGLPPTAEALTADAPELLEPLRACVDGLESLHRLATGDSSDRQPVGREDDDRRLGDFQLHEELGRGGMGVVYRATQISLRRTVAIKLLPLSAVLDSRQLKRFQHEAEAAAGLQHPHIVPVFAVGCERGVHFYAMQYVNGVSLDHWIEQQRIPIGHDWRATVSDIIDVAEGLHAAHEFGVVHRDVKPSNLMLDRGGKVWITDFGLARIQSDASLTRSGDVVGTMRYMSPEQARGESAIVDGRTDIYSLGATLYELLCLKPAHQGDDAPAILRIIEEDAITPVRRHRPELPSDLETVIAKAMSKNRDSRYETAQSMADDLRRVLAGEPTFARPPTTIDRCVRLASRHRTAVLTGALVCGLAMIGFAVGTAMLAAEKRVSDANAFQAQQYGQQSQKNERIAREAIDRLGTQMAELLADIPAANSVRHRLLTETLDYYERIAAESVGPTVDPQRMRDLAVTYGKIGTFQGELGDELESLESLKRSEQLYQRLAVHSPDDIELQLQWSISQNNLADRLVRSGQLRGAAEWFAKAIGNQKRSRELTSVSQPAENDLAILITTEMAKTLNNLGRCLDEAENDDESEAVYRRAMKLLEDVAGQATLRATVQANLAGLLTKRNPEQASRLARQSLDHQLESLQQNSGDAKVATQVVLTLHTLAGAQSQSSQPQEAIVSLDQALQIGRQLHQRWPDQSSYRRDLVISLNHIGLAYSAVGKRDQACAAFEEALGHGRWLGDAFNSDAEIHSMLGGVMNNLAFLKQQLGQRDEAMKYFDAAIEHQQIAARLAPQVPRYQTFLKTHEQNLQRLRGDS